MSGPLALLADIGGTNARFAIADTRERAPLRMDSVRQFEVSAFPSLVDAARHYLSDAGAEGRSVGSAVFAVAGRIDGDSARITNHPWVISRLATQRELGLQRLRLVNDFTAQALAIGLLAAPDLVTIGPAWSPSDACDRTYAVLGPGTGLGVSALIVRDGKAIALETEGGHASFAPGTAEEAAILHFLSEKFGRVSNERLVSGSGLVNIHAALARIDGQTAPPELRPRDITSGMAGGDERCQRAVDIFCAVFGAIAGDLALTLGAWDGVFLAGGLVPKLLPQLQQSGFRQRFEAKGRFAAAMATVPTVAMVHPQPGLLGAAALALDAPTRASAAVG